jgi:hypothetical protein
MAGDWLDGAGSGQQLDAVAILTSHPGEGIAALVQAGALVSLSLTSDGGALGVTVTVDGRWRRDYFRNEEELEAWLAEAVPAVQAARGSTVPPASNDQRSTRRKAS